MFHTLSLPVFTMFGALWRNNQKKMAVFLNLFSLSLKCICITQGVGGGGRGDTMRFKCFVFRRVQHSDYSVARVKSQTA